MLQVPAHSEIDGVMIYSDDALFYKFYPLASEPVVRLDENGDPIFLLVNFSFSNEEREANRNLPTGAGYLNFDIELSVPEQTLAKIRQTLQTEVNAAYQQKRATNSPDVAGMTEAPQVLFGAPTFTEGQVMVFAPTTDALTTSLLTEGKPSLMAGNVSVFNMGLTAAGADFMRQTLIGSEGTGETDLTPIQVRYDLKFWARLPDVRIHVEVDSKKVYEYVHKQMDGAGRDYCTTYDFQFTDEQTETATSTGAIKVQIDNGGALPEKVLEELRKYALDLVKQMIEVQMFEEDEHGGGSDDDFDSQNPQPANYYYYYRGNTKKHLKKTYDEQTMSIRFDLEQRSVIEWPISPQSTMQTFFRDMNEAKLKQFVRVIRLEDPFFQTLGLQARVFADYEQSQIQFVQVNLRYSGKDFDGQTRTETEVFTFTKSDSDIKTWDPSLIGDVREYEYQYKVGFEGGRETPMSEWISTDARDLNLSVPTGRVETMVVAGDVDFANLIDHVQVRLAYEDPANNVERQEQVVKLTGVTPDDRYSRQIFMEPRQPLQYRSLFKLKSGEVREDSEWHQHRGPQLLINQPFENILRVTLLPTGNGWEDVTQVMVNLQYDDAANQIHETETIVLRTRDEFKIWQVELRNKNLRNFKYSYIASFRSGATQVVDWMPSDDVTVRINITRPGYRITLVPDALNFTRVPTTEVTLRYVAAGQNKQATFVFTATNKVSQAWLLDVPQGAPLEYKVQVTHYPVDTAPVVMPELTEHDEFVVLQPYNPPSSGALEIKIFGGFVDYSVTPLVTVDLRYDDDQNNLHLFESLEFMQKETKTWTIDVKDTSLTRVSYVLNYFDTDGKPIPQDTAPNFEDKRRIVIPAYVSN